MAGCEDLAFKFHAALDLETDIEADSRRNSSDDSAEDALILVHWKDNREEDKRRFVLMLWRWVGKDRAERRGLLSRYRDEYDAETLRQIPKTRRTFILQ